MIWKRYGSEHSIIGNVMSKNPATGIFSFDISKHEAGLAARVQRPPNSSERTPTVHTFDSKNG